MTRKWYHNGPQNGLSVPVYSTDGHVLHAATSESADAFVAELNLLERRVSDIKNVMENGEITFKNESGDVVVMKGRLVTDKIE